MIWDLSYKMSLFGWCSTGQHKLCRVSYIDWNKNNRSCSCKCHSEASGE